MLWGCIVHYINPFNTIFFTISQIRPFMDYNQKIILYNSMCGLPRIYIPIYFNVLYN